MKTVKTEYTVHKNEVEQFRFSEEHLWREIKENCLLSIINYIDDNDIVEWQKEQFFLPPSYSEHTIIRGKIITLSNKELQDVVDALRNIKINMYYIPEKFYKDIESLISIFTEKEIQG